MFATYCLVFEILKFIPMQCKPPCLPILKDQERMDGNCLVRIECNASWERKSFKALTCSGLQLCFVVALCRGMQVELFQLHIVSSFCG